MKVLIGCGGLEAASVLFSDLRRAGLPPETEAVVFSAADVFMPPGPDPHQKVYATAAQELEKARRIAEQAGEDLRREFPGWKVLAEAAADSPAWGIVKKAEAWKANLVVIGSHGWSGVAGLFLGSVAQRVLAEAHCSVRIVHRAPEESDSPVRLLLGFDGSPDAEKAADSIVARPWKKGSTVLLLTAFDPRLATSLASLDRWMGEGNEDPWAWIERIRKTAEQKLRNAGLTVSSAVKEGDPKHVLLDEAQRWGADSIFLGARGSSGVKRLLVGGVSMAVAARAHCAVEVVRNS
jgi:nucleotide-binding universal stress UspA family protein